MMTPRDQNSVAEREVSVRVRRIERADGGPLTLVTSCPRTARSMPLATCVECEHCVGLSLTGDGDGVIRCELAPLGSASPALFEDVSQNELDTTKVLEIMPTTVVCVPPEMGVEELARMFLERNISGAPVTDEAGLPIGVVSKTDLLRVFRMSDTRDEPSVPPTERESEPPRSERGLRVTDVMTAIAFTLCESASVARAAALMSFEGVHRVPVVGMDGRVVGLVSSLDILRWIARKSGYLLAPT